MKNKYLISLFFGLLIAPLSMLRAQVAINTDGSAPSAKAMLDIKSTDKGVLLPRMTTAQRTAIAPTTTQKGLLVYDTETNSVWQYNGTAWVEIGAAAASLWTAQNATSIYTTNQTVGINTTSPNPNAILDLTSTNKALLPPRMSFDQIKAIPSPTEGMLAYDTDFKCLRMYTGSEWQCQQAINKELSDPPGDFSILATATGGVAPLSTATDASGNVYVTGYFNSATATFGSITLTNSNSGSNDVFVAKYNSSGVVQWAIKGGGSDADMGNSIAVDGNGNVYIIGSFISTTATFGLTTLTSSGSYDVFVVKYNSSGVVQWAVKGGGSAYEEGNGIAVDGSGNVYITGFFASATATFGSTNLTNSGNGDVFVIKYNTSSVLQWAVSGGGASSDLGIDIAVDGSGNVYITGILGSATAIFGPTASSPFNITLTKNSSDAEVFVVKYNANGVVQWAVNGGGTGTIEKHGIAVDGSGNVYITGNFTSPTATFGSITLTNSGGYDVFVVKYNSSGVVQWAVKGGGNNNDSGNAIAVDGSGNVYITGYFTSTTATFYSASGYLTTLTNTSSNISDVFVVKYNTSGVVQWVVNGGGRNHDAGNAIAANASGKRVYTVGTFTPNAKFGNTILKTGNYFVWMYGE